MSLGENIRKIRELRNYSQKFMAIKLGISQEKFSYLETKQKNIDDITLNRISNILNVNVNLIKIFDANKFLDEWNKRYE